MTNQHPITPPPELERQWSTQYIETPMSFADLVNEVARWGADQELEACCLVLDNGEHAASYGCHDGISLRAARRPKPLSLKEHALDELTSAERLYPADWSSIRKALEALPND